MNKNVLKLITVSVLAAALAACNGGSSSGSSNPQVAASQVAAPDESGVALNGYSALYTTGGEGSQVTVYIPTGTTSNPYTSTAPSVGDFALTTLPSVSYITIPASGNADLVLQVGSYVWSAGANGSTNASTPVWESTNFTGTTSTVAAGSESAPQFVISYNKLAESPTQPIFFTGVGSSHGGLAYNIAGATGTAESTSNYDTCLAESNVSSNPNVTAITAAVTESSGSTTTHDYIGIGTQTGDICVYNVESGTFSNLTASTVTSRSLYTTTSPVAGVAYASLSTGNYGYWYNNNGMLWRVTATTTNTPVTFVQLNGASGTAAGISNAPAAGAGAITAIFVDGSNNLYVGTSQGVVYALANGQTGFTNVTLTPTTGTDGTQVYSFTYTTTGTIQAVTQKGNVYNISL